MQSASLTNTHNTHMGHTHTPCTHNTHRGIIMKVDDGCEPTAEEVAEGVQRG